MDFSLCRSGAYYYHKLSVNIPRSKNARNCMNSVPLYTGEGGKRGPGKSAKKVLTQNLRNLKQHLVIIICVNPL